VRIIAQIAIAHLLNRRRQSLVSILGVAMGVGFFIGTSALMRGSQNDMVERLIDTAPHITIKDEYRNPQPQPVMALYAHGAVELRGLKPRETVRGLRAAAAMIEALDARADLDAAPALTGQVILRFAIQDKAVTLNGIDVDRELRISKLDEDMVIGKVDDLETVANGIILGEELAKRIGVRARDTLTVTSAAGTTKKMKVVGLFRSGVMGIDRSTAYAKLRDVQVLLDRPNIVNQIRIRMSDYNAARDVAAEIERRFVYRAESWQEANEDLLGLLVVRNVIMYSIVTAILIVASFGIYNVISTIVYEKVRDIAILKSMGFEESDIRSIFVLEGSLVGLVGMVLGWVLGYGIIWGLGLVELRAGGIVEMQRFPLDTSFFSYAVGGAFAMVSSVLAAFLPARRAARLRPVEILRGAA
jgi:lipoprotein-releasing system permease protein